MTGRTSSLGSAVDLFDPFEPDLFSVLKFVHHPVHVLGEFQVPNFSLRKMEASEIGRQNCIAVLTRLAENAKKKGITLGLEPVNRYESNLINTAEQALDIIKQTGADNIVVHLDSFHINIEEQSIRDAIERCGNKLGYFHIGESNRGYLGSGTIDFKCLFQCLKENHYQGVITFESFSSTVVSPQLSNTLAIWRNLWHDSEDLARHAKAFMEQQIKNEINKP